MKLIGMLDSPYVRRVAIGMKLMGMTFEHQALSVFSTYDQFKSINPLVKAPTLVLDNGQILIDSTLILDYLAPLAENGAALMPSDAEGRLRATQWIGLALAACEKTVQIVYEQKLRPAEKQHEPWLDRVREQLFAAYDALEKALGAAALPKSQEALGLADMTVAVAWAFTQLMLPGVVAEARCPKVAAFSQFAESLPVFLDTPLN